MNPTSSDVGTYVVRVHFKLFNVPTISTEKTFVVEVYPALNYG